MGLEALIPTLLPVAGRVLGNLGMTQAPGYAQQAQQLYDTYRQARQYTPPAGPRPPVVIRLPAQPLAQQAPADNTLLYIAGGAAALAAVYFIMRK